MRSFRAKAAFEAGQHIEIVNRLSLPGKTSEETTALIGALSFLGRLDEALPLWTLKHSKLRKEDQSRARFALALAHTRLSRFKSARRLLKESLACPVGCKLADVSQGIAIYHYYRGNFEKAAHFSQEALKRALASGDAYIHAFALDLNGHALVQTGRRSSGLRKLREALTLSKRKEKLNPFSLAILLYEAEAGFRPSTIVGELESAQDALSSEDSYSRANLSLELSRQFTLRGEWKRAQQTLDAVSSVIYGFENRRQEATLQIRLAELACRRGDITSALHFLQSAKRCLERISDRSYEIRVEGLEKKILSLSDGTLPSRDRRVVGTTDRVRGEDPLGDLLDSLATHPEETFPRLLDAGYLGLLGQALNLDSRSNHFVLLDNGAWVALSPDGIFRNRSALSKQNTMMIRALASGLESKADLISKVWGYKYDSLRHDSVLYSAVAALRKSLGPVGHWVESRDSGWSLRNRGQSIQVRDGFLPSNKRSAETIISFDIRRTSFEARVTGLNWRQLKALRRLETQQPWSVPDYKESFQVSTMTAWRDLDGLEKSGYLKRIGRGRATVYVFTQEA